MNTPLTPPVGPDNPAPPASGEPSAQGRLVDFVVQLEKGQTVQPANQIGWHRWADANRRVASLRACGATARVMRRERLNGLVVCLEAVDENDK